MLEAGEGEPCPTVPAGQKLIALTFDDGPRRSTTTRLLDGLSERGVKATFFLIGAQIENNGDVVRRMDEKGHQIGIHTFDHVKLTDLSRTDFDAQVETTRALLKSTLGHNDFLLRPPYGMLDESVKAWAGCPIILWSIDPEDWRDCKHRPVEKGGGGRGKGRRNHPDARHLPRVGGRRPPDCRPAPPAGLPVQHGGRALCRPGPFP